MLDNPRFLTLLLQFMKRFEDLRRHLHPVRDELKFSELISIYLAQTAHRLVNTRSLSLLNFLKEKKFLESKKENDVDGDDQRDDDEMRQVMAARLVKLSRCELLMFQKGNDKDIAACCSQLNDRLAEHASGKKKGPNPEPFFERVDERAEAMDIIVMAEKQLSGK